MSAGKLAAGAIVISAVVAGIAMYWLQVYAFYDEVVFEPGNEVRLTLVESGQPEAILAEDVTGIDVDGGLLSYRACFTTSLSQAMLSETYQLYTKPEPTSGPSWFDCYDARTVGEALEAGQALAFLSEPLKPYGMDRVVAVFSDGRGVVWHQINECGKAWSEKSDLPEGCPPPPPEPTNEVN